MSENKPRQRIPYDVIARIGNWNEDAFSKRELYEDCEIMVSAYEKLQKECEELREQRNKINHEFKMLQSGSDRQRKEFEELKVRLEREFQHKETLYEKYTEMKQDAAELVKDLEKAETTKSWNNVNVALEAFKSKYPAKKEE